MSDSGKPEIGSHRKGGSELASDQIDLGRLASMLWGGKWWIFGFAAAGFLLGFLYLAVTPYSYTTDALLKIEGSNSSPLGGLAGSPDAGLTESLSGNDAALGEIPIIKSREVLGQTVREMQLTVEAELQRMPIIGSLFPVDDFQLEISEFDLPAVYLKEGFTLSFPDDSRFELAAPDGETLLRGIVGGKPADAMLGGEKISLAIASTTNVAGKQFILVKQPWLAAVNQLKANLDVSEAQSGSGILQLSINGPDKHHITKLVNSVAKNYVQQNVEARSQDAEQSLKFLNSQLPKLKKEVNEADARLAEYQENHQPVDLTAEAQALLQRVSAIENSQSELRLKIAQLSEQYTPRYPEVQAARSQLAQLKQERAELNQKINRLPNNQKEILGLQREVKVNTQLYTSLLNRAQELRVVKAGTIGNVRIVDPAVVPLSPTAPRPKLVLVALSLLGVLIGIGAVFLRAALRQGVSDPAELEKHTGHPVYAVIPYSTWLAKEARRRQSQKGAATPILARDHADDLVVEALRSLRTSLHFAQMESDSNVIMITGPAPGVGKSFLSLNLGYLLADAGQRIAVIDADMRRGHIHDIFEGHDRGIGLAEVLAGRAVNGQAIRNIPGTSLDLVTSGAIPPNPSELLMRPRFAEFVAELRKQYDMVILDAPPILAVTDAGIIAGTVPDMISFLVLHAGKHPIKEIDESIARFTRQGGKLAGLVLNRYRAAGSESGYGYTNYHYHYASDRN